MKFMCDKINAVYEKFIFQKLQLMHSFIKKYDQGKLILFHNLLISCNKVDKILIFSTVQQRILPSFHCVSQ